MKLKFLVADLTEQFFLTVGQNNFGIKIPSISLWKSRKYIPKSWVCDADPDCGVGDTSDESAHCVYQTLNNPMSELL